MRYQQFGWSPSLDVSVCRVARVVIRAVEAGHRLSELRCSLARGGCPVKKDVDVGIRLSGLPMTCLSRLIQIDCMVELS